AGGFSMTKKIKILLMAPAVVVALYLIFLSQIGRLLNTTVNAPPYQTSGEAKALHQKLLVADMHADSLVWGRDLLERGSWGHVDVPRLIEGNVTLQAFTVITENTTQLALAGRWPIGAWSSLTKRALYQADRFHKAAAASGGKLTIIKTRDDLEKYLE